MNPLHCGVIFLPCDFVSYSDFMLYAYNLQRKFLLPIKKNENKIWSSDKEKMSKSHVTQMIRRKTRVCEMNHSPRASTKTKQTSQFDTNFNCLFTRKSF